MPLSALLLAFETKRLAGVCGVYHHDGPAVAMVAQWLAAAAALKKAVGNCCCVATQPPASRLRWGGVTVVTAISPSWDAADVVCRYPRRVVVVSATPLCVVAMLSVVPSVSFRCRGHDDGRLSLLPVADGVFVAVVMPVASCGSFC